jgi:hypothetical protein
MKCNEYIFHTDNKKVNEDDLRGKPYHPRSRTRTQETLFHRSVRFLSKIKHVPFGVMEVDLFGHRITQEGLKMDDHKVKAILDWEPLKSVLTLRSFFGLVSHYRKFIKNFVKITTPLTNVLKKSSGTYKWDETCNETFETLKGILVKAPMLKLPDFDKDFEIHSDASNFAIGGVLLQDGSSVAFENKKFNEIE